MKSVVCKNFVFVFGIFISYYLIKFVFDYFSIIFLYELGIDIDYLKNVSTLFTSICLLLILFPFKSKLEIKRLKNIQIVIVLSLVLFSGFAVNFLIEIFESLNYIEFRERVKLNESKINFYLVFLISIIIIPIIEEVVFRGLILNRLIQEKSKKALFSIVLSSILFALIHDFEIASLMISFGLGIIIGYIYVFTKNLFYCFIFHICYNLIWFILKRNIRLWETLDSLIELSFLNSMISIFIITLIIILLRKLKFTN